MTQDSTQRPALRSQRLNQITHEPHGKLDALVKTHAPFETQANFARFVVAQYLFQSELVALYNDAELTAAVPRPPRRTWQTWKPKYRRQSQVPCTTRAQRRRWAGSLSLKARSWAPRS